MDQLGYVYSLYEQSRPKTNELGTVANRILLSFMKREICSAYQCCKDLNEIYAKEGKSITYKNVYKRVQKLYSYKLIEKIKNQNGNSAKHGAVYYKLTSSGIFYAIKNFQAKEMFLLYKNNTLFKIFLYPYIKQTTLENLHEHMIRDYFFSFLSECCLKVEEYFEHIVGYAKSIDFICEITDTSSIVDQKYDDRLIGSKKFIEYLRKRLNITWLNQYTTKIKEIKENSLIKIIDGTNELTIEFADKDMIPALCEGDKVLLDLFVSKVGSKYRIEVPIPDTYGPDSPPYDSNEFRENNIEEILPFSIYQLNNMIRRSLHELYLSIIDLRLSLIYHKGDLKILSTDDLFMNQLNKVKTYIDNSYYQFVKYQQL